MELDLRGTDNANGLASEYNAIVYVQFGFPSVQDIYVVKGLTKPLLGRPAIQALGIISNVNLSSVDVDLVTEKNESYYRARYPKVFKGLGKPNWTYTIALYSDAKPFALSVPRRIKVVRGRDSVAKLVCQNDEFGSSLENATAFASLAKDSSTEGPCLRTIRLVLRYAK
jgi:hypothetical protein